MIGLVALAVVVAAGLTWLVLGIRGAHNSKTVRTTAPPIVTTPADVANRPKAIGKVKSTVPSHTPTPTAAVTIASTPKSTAARFVAPPATITTPATAAPPKQYGASALTWSAPASMTILTGRTAVLAVAAHNHTDGTVTLPHPLSCTPRLDHGEICAQVVQLLPHGTSAGAQYTIDAHGIAPGHYTLRIEGVLSVQVTVRP